MKNHENLPQNGYVEVQILVNSRFAFFALKIDF